ncbi:hypothetical protein EDC04DRAFT_2606310 [Pisolithus marmoratus]|nr:hypothetical protein EDC04DRAFT_2606310 [Pisolithus marmoratus]
MVRSSTQKQKAHKPMEGYEVCAHTCSSLNAIKGQLWVVEGGSGVWHAKKDSQHPKCNDACPGSKASSTERGRANRTRKPTHEEIMSGLAQDLAVFELHRLKLPPMTEEDIEAFYGGIEVEDDNTMMEVDKESVPGGSGSRHSSSVAGPSWHALSEAGPSTQSHHLPPFTGKSPSANKEPWYPFEKLKLKTFNILYIPDPSHAVKTKQEAENNLAWASREITLNQFNAISNLTGFVYKERVTKTGVRVRVTEWLWLILQMDNYDKGTAFNIKYMTWENFKDVVLDPNTRAFDWNDLVKKDCIIGGIDYSIDHRWDGNPYGFATEDQFKKYESHLEPLTETVQFWPPAEQIKQAGKKWPTIISLQLMAQMNHEYFPRTVVLKDGTAIEESTVLKRSNSDCGKYVILPTAAAKYRTWKYLKSCINNKEIWMSQEYVDTLATIGEWRTFIIGGKILSVVHTQKKSDGKWIGTPTESFLTGTEIHDMLVREEAVFCRMDVGLKITNDGCPHYFVNEVERSTTTSLWLASNLDNTMGTMADTFAMVFRQWLHDMRNAYVVA